MGRPAKESGTFPEDAITVPEAAQILDVHRSRVHHFITRGDLKSYSRRGRRYVSRSEVDSLANERVDEELPPLVIAAKKPAHLAIVKESSEREESHRNEELRIRRAELDLKQQESLLRSSPQAPSTTMIDIMLPVTILLLSFGTALYEKHFGVKK